MLYNYVPTSGHPGGSISSGRFVSGIVFNSLDYDVADPDRADADIISYAAGHKTLGLYALWALRNEVMRIGCPELLPTDEKHQLRLEDLLGFRRNPLTRTPLFLKYRVKPLDGHPTPATPFLRLSTGASGVGVTASLGLALGAMDYYGSAAPRVHIVEGEGGMTPGRVGEAMAAAGTACLKNAILHVDWNQASIDSNRVCRDGDAPGANTSSGTRWSSPCCTTGMPFWSRTGWISGRSLAAQRRALAIRNDTSRRRSSIAPEKGWQYGVEGKASHGAGHGLCADGFFKAVAPFRGGRRPASAVRERQPALPGGRGPGRARGVLLGSADGDPRRPGAKPAPGGRVRRRLREARGRLDGRVRTPRPQAPAVQAVFELAAKTAGRIPAELTLKPGQAATLRGELGDLAPLQPGERGRLLDGLRRPVRFNKRQYHRAGVPGGLVQRRHEPRGADDGNRRDCEDAMSGILAGLSTFGRHIGVGSSYGAFLAALGHVAARLHAIGNQARQAVCGEPYKPFILVCAHAGVKTGEDGPTHADPQALQLFQGNFPLGTMITLTPWDPQEIWPLVSAALAKRPAVVAPFVTRPSEKVIDRKALGLSAGYAPPAAGVYLLLGRRASATARTFSRAATSALRLRRAGLAA